MTITNTEGLSELLPCPFCGGEALTHNAPGSSRLWAVSCKNCDAGPHGKWTPALAVAAWNRRAANSAGGVEVKALAAGQRAAMESNGCGLMYMGLRHFCDHPHLPDEMRSATCACKIDAKAAIEAYLTHPCSSVSAEVTERAAEEHLWTTRAALTAARRADR